MRVLFVSNDVELFDSTTPTYARMKAYADIIGELHVLSRATQPMQRQDGALHLHGLRPLPTIIGRALFFYTLLHHTRALVRRHHIEVVSAQDPFEHGWVAMRAVNGTSAKLHIQVHTDFLSPFFKIDSFKNSLRVRIASRVLPRADGIRVVSDLINRQLIKRYGKSIPKPTIIPVVTQLPLSANSIPISPSIPRLPFTFVLMAIGRLEKEKRLGDAIAVVAKLVQEKHSVGLLIAGLGSKYKALTRTARTLGVKDNVIFLGNRVDVSDLLKNTAQVFIQTSAYEGYGRTYIETALAEIPMVVTNVGIINDVFVSGDSALVCEVGDIECLHKHVSKLIEDVSLRHSLAVHARTAVQKHLDSFGDISKRIVDDFAKTILSSR